MATIDQALSAIPAGLRTPLLAEYTSIVQNFRERRWGPSALSGGMFCEIVFNILDGHAKSSYPPKPSKPSDFVAACRALEANKHSPRSFRILIPRLLPALYEIRNNRGAAHAGGAVDPNHMDASAVLSMSSWILAELVRVFQGLDVVDAQQLVDSLVELPVPLVWESDGMKRVFNYKMSLEDKIMLLIAHGGSGRTDVDKLFEWTGYDRREYFDRLLRNYHDKCLIIISPDNKSVGMLPSGSVHVEELIRRSLKALT